MSARTRRLAIAAGIVLAVAAAFGRAASYDFIELDDRGYVADNAIVQKGLTGEGIGWALTSFERANWHPLTWISLMLDRSIGGPGPSTFHVANVVYHAAAAVLLFLLLVRLTAQEGRSAAASLLFAIHPLRVESVVWIAERKDVLSQALGFAALYAWVLWVEKPSRARYVTALGLFAAGLMAKPMLVTLPVLMVLLDRWPLDRFDVRRSVREKLPFFALSALSAIVTLVAQSRAGAVSGLEVVPLPTRLANACVSTIDYLVLTLWPHGLANPYPYDLSRLTLPRVAASALAIAALTALAAGAWRTKPHWSVGWGWYLATLLPVVGIIQVGPQSMADRYTYLPLVGPVVALVWELGDRLARPAAIALAATVVAAFSVLTVRQASLWRDTTTLFEHTISVTGPSAVAHHALGRSLYRQGRFEDSVAELHRSLEIWDRYTQAWVALGESLIKLGRTGEAIEAYQRAVSYGERDPELRAKLSAALTSEGTRRLRGGDLAGAEVELRRAVQASPDDAAAHGALGVVLARAGKLDEAEHEFADAVRLDPENTGFAGNLERIRTMRRGG